MGKKQLLDQIYRPFFTIPLERLYFKECSNECESNDISILDIVFGGDHGQGKFR